ncbi:unnamed protein product [Didymodactylos carnosus]|uniref:Uncharacterized protein n=1 Tax=Didymodactylos carnosus TaxID=1234261 RepID=A0A8S2E7J1_9BILA|nr:unnamed protein product [Didymodactylos carnosus]CAF3915898.1 unnamed protein product [Didymodactylos carnosus]
MTPVTSSRNETIIIDEDSEELDHSDIDILTNRFNGFNDKAHVKLNTFNTPDGGGGDGRNEIKFLVEKQKAGTVFGFIPYSRDEHVWYLFGINPNTGSKRTSLVQLKRDVVANKCLKHRQSTLTNDDDEQENDQDEQANNPQQIIILDENNNINQDEEAIDSDSQQEAGEEQNDSDSSSTLEDDWHT